MKIPAQKKRLLLAGAVLLGAAVLLLGGAAWREYRSSHHKLYAEIICCYPDYNSVLAADLEDQFGCVLFTFPWPEGADPALKQPGMLVELTGPDLMALSYPGQYSPVRAVKKTGQREDFIEKYYNTLQKELEETGGEALGDRLAGPKRRGEGRAALPSLERTKSIGLKQTKVGTTQWKN